MQLIDQSEFSRLQFLGIGSRQYRIFSYIHKSHFSAGLQLVEVDTDKLFFEKALKYMIDHLFHKTTFHNKKFHLEFLKKGQVNS